MKKLWPRSLSGQMILLVLVGLLVAQLISYLIYRSQQQDTLRSLRNEFVAARISGVDRLLAETQRPLHQRIVRTASTPSLRFSINPRPIFHAQSANNVEAAELRQRLANLLNRNIGDIRINLEVTEDFRRHDDHDSRRHRERRQRPIRRLKGVKTLAVAIRLSPGHWLNVVGTGRPAESFWRWSTLLSLISAALILSILMVLAVRRITKPLAALTGAAESFGRGETIATLKETGPGDVRDTIAAFNQMRERLERFVRDRTLMLAAISHDLRTPIAALRVRAELIEDDETRQRILNTLEEMQQMTEAVLSFVREESAQEDTRLVDIAALIDSLCDDLIDTGAEVSFQTSGKTPYRCRPLSLKRALQNLIKNAVTYGQRAEVQLSRDDDSLIINIDDEGPGISEQDKERIFEPFVRLEDSRNRETGGVGLGLSIARSIVRSHGGDISLNNRTERGLRVTVSLPLAR